MSKSAKKKSEIMSLKEVEEVLGIKRRTIYNRIASGELKAREKGAGAKIRTRLEFDRAEIERYIKENS